MEDQIKKNQQILKETWITELDETLANVRAQTKTFWGGIAGFFLNPIVSVIYNFFLSPEIREKTLNQIDILLEAAEAYNGDDQKLIDEYFEEFKKNDIAYIRCKKKHPKFQEILEKMKIYFVHRVASTAKLIRSKGNTHGELIVNNYPTLEDAKADLNMQLNDAEDQLDFTIEHKLLAVNRLILPQTIKILKGEIRFRRKLFETSLTEYFKTLKPSN
ncbi:MAG: hypothetical protein ACTSVY_08080 [Candidatus Helarchaeota archaeon]